MLPHFMESPKRKNNQRKMELEAAMLLRFIESGKKRINYEELVKIRKESNSRVVTRGPAIPDERKLELLEASRRMAIMKGKEFFYVHYRCLNCREFSKRYVSDGRCVKCQK